MEQELTLTQEWDKVFPLSEKVNHKKVTFKTQYGLTLAADLYTPAASEKLKVKSEKCKEPTLSTVGADPCVCPRIWGVNGRVIDMQVVRYCSGRHGGLPLRLGAHV